MSNIFETILRMSVAASFVVVALLIFRPLLKKFPSGLRSLLWVMVAIRLLCPVLIESKCSIIPQSVVITSSVTAPVTNGTPVAPPSVPPQESLQVLQPVPQLPQDTTVEIVSKKPSPLAIGANIWLAVAGLMLIYFVVNYLRLKKCVAPSVKIGDRLYICDGIDSPFIMGMFSPRIYLPSDLKDEYIDVIVSHERAHILRCDHIQKMVAYLALSIHWFNPFIWCAYWLFCRDIELACDERVVNGKTNEYKKLYAKALLYCCADKGSLAPCRVAFGEKDAKHRISKVIKHKKASLWVVLAGILIGALIAVCLLTNPKSEPDGLSSSTQSESNDGVSKIEESVGNESFGSNENAESSAPEESTVPDESPEISAPEESTVPDESTEVSAPDDKPSVTPVVTPQEHLSLQSTHVTADELDINKDCEKYIKKELAPLYVMMNDKERHLYHLSTSIKKSGLKVWLCDSQGKKIDYVTTNSDGVAKFVVYEGNYSIYFEGDDTYAPCWSEVFSIKRITAPSLTTSAFKHLATYKTAVFKPCTVTVLDADTGKPIKNTHVTRCKYKDNGLYTDANGKVTLSPLIEYNGEGDDFCALQFACNGYITQRLEINVYENSVTIRLSKEKEYRYTVKIIDSVTGEGVEGVALILSNYGDTSKIYTAVSGKDGIVSGVKTSNELALFPQVNLYYSAEGIPYERRTEEGEGRYARFSIVLSEGDNEYIVKLERNDTTVRLFW